MHPGENHVRVEALMAIHDHFDSAGMSLGSQYFTFDWRPSPLPGSNELTVLDSSDREVARYKISVTATKVCVPKVVEVEPEPVWRDGAWSDIQVFDRVLGEDGNQWKVEDVTAPNTGILHVTVSRKDQRFTFTPTVDQPVRYFRIDISWESV